MTDRDTAFFFGSLPSFRPNANFSTTALLSSISREPRVRVYSDVKAKGMMIWVRNRNAKMSVFIAAGRGWCEEPIRGT